MSSVTSFRTMADVLASEGIINYDAVAYVNGTKPRYIGRPRTYANAGMPYLNTGCFSPYNSRYCRLPMGLSSDAFLSSSQGVNAAKTQRNIDILRKVGAASALVTGALLLRKGCGALARLGNKISSSLSGAGSTGASAATGAATGLKGKIGGAFSKVGAALKKVKIPGPLKVAVAAGLTIFGAYKIVKHKQEQGEINGSIYNVPKY